MVYTLAELARLTATELVGDGSFEVKRLTSLERATSTSLSFLSNDVRRAELKNSRAGAFVVSRAVAEDISRGLISADPYRTYAELSVLFEEFGKSLVIEPYLSNVVLAATVLDKSNFSNKVELIEAICSGSMHVSLAFAEPANSYDYFKSNTNISDDNKLNGTKSLVLNGKNASKLIVSCVKNDSLSLVLVDQNASGVSFNSFRICISAVDGLLAL